MDTIRTAEILCVGTELLMGQIVNTNAAFLARQLSEIGISSYYQTVVGDNPERLAAQIRIAASRSDCVLITGGLGPTADDITMGVAASVAGIPLALHEPSRQAILTYLQRLGRRTVTDNNWKMAMLPVDGTVLPNLNGTAPGAMMPCVIEGHESVLILTPGPPSELVPMFSDSIRPFLEAHAPQRLHTHFVRLIGIGESSAEDRLKDLIATQINPTIAPYVSEGEVMFRVTQYMATADDADRTGPLLDEIKQRLGDYIYEIGPRSMPQVVRDLLLEQNRTVSFAESCTGGLLSGTLTDWAGISAVFKGAVIAYDNRIKEDLLHVPAAVLEQDGAVSESCAIAMAEGCRMVMKTDFAVSVTGIAGPDGATAEKPVGLVYVGIAGPKGASAVRLNLAGNRARIRRVSVIQALNLLRQHLLA